MHSLLSLETHYHTLPCHGKPQVPVLRSAIHDKELQLWGGLALVSCREGIHLHECQVYQLKRIPLHNIGDMSYLETGYPSRA